MGPEDCIQKPQSPGKAAHQVLTSPSFVAAAEGLQFRETVSQRKFEDHLRGRSLGVDEEGRGSEPPAIPRAPRTQRVRPWVLSSDSFKAIL